MLDIGIDEVGRGSWAGPLLVVALKNIKSLPPGVRDSKELTRKKRLLMYQSIINNVEIGEGWVSSEEIDKLGISRSMFLGVNRALKKIDAQKMDFIIMDGPVNYCSSFYTNVRCEVKADQKYQAVCAASIVAKVLRDTYMINLAKIYPQYHFDKNVGYGTSYHLKMLRKCGTTSEHRLTFKPIQNVISTSYS
ncbi:MAG: hypothetical protein NVS3B23_05810 [Candidatus Saccharimonadales bacterium]